MNVLTMRSLLTGLAIAAIASGCAKTSTPLPANTEQIADGVYLFRSGGERSLFLVSDAGVIVTDPINAGAATAYRQAIAAITDLPVKFVVYSHYHWDRVSGGKIFADEGAKFIAQERCAERFSVNPNPDVVTPDFTFTDYYELALGDKSLEMFYFGPSHGDCMTVFLVQPANMLQIGELVNPPRASFPDDPNVPYVKPHNLRQFFESLETLVAEKGINEVIASAVHEIDDGKGGQTLSPATAPASIIHDQAMFWDAIYDTVFTAREEGNVGIDSFVKMKAIDQATFEPYDGYKKEDLPIIMRRFVGFADMGR